MEELLLRILRKWSEVIETNNNDKNTNLTYDVFKVFDLKFSIKSKTSYGGTSFENIKKMIRSYSKKKYKEI